MRQGYCYTCLTIGGGYFGRVTKISSPFLGRGCDEALFSEKKRLVSGGNSVNGEFCKDFFRIGNSVKRSRPFREPPDSEN